LGSFRSRGLVALPALAGAVFVAVSSPDGGALDRWSGEPGAIQLARAIVAASWLVPVAVALAAARFNQSRLVLACLGLAALAHALASGSLALEGPGAPAMLIAIALATGLASRLDERGVATRAGVRRSALLAVLLVLPAHLAASRPGDLARALEALGPSPQPTPGTGTPWIALALVACCAVAAWRAGGRDADVVGGSLLATGGACAGAVVLTEGSALAAPAPALAPAILLLGAAATLALGVHVLAWRRGYVDDLTGLHGRRALDEALDRLSGAYAMAVVDVDHFKRFNDEHGHDAGDDALGLVAAVLSGVRGGTAYRQGGEEFVVLFPGRTLSEAAEALDALRAAIEDTPLLVRGRRRGARSCALRVTASIGAAERSPRNATARDTLRAADQALLRAKRLGRNRVELERRRVGDPGRRASGPRVAPRARTRARAGSR
jgi:diguanylate cyclase (GGDEF)-like protein